MWGYIGFVGLRGCCRGWVLGFKVQETSGADLTGLPYYPLGSPLIKVI